MWQSWTILESKFNDEEIKPFKEKLEQMNTYLENAGRAIGHRVWQSIESYMANYPPVIQAKQEQEKEDEKNNDELEKIMRLAFEDQIVQKVMPKLRGIETFGKARTECLDLIRKLLDDFNLNLSDDFHLACLGDQFVWNSAKYLEAGE